MSRLERLAPLTGVVFVALIIVSLILIAEDAPDFVEEPREVADYYAGNTGRLIAGFYIGALANVFLIWFAGSLRSALRSAEGGEGRLAAVAFGGGVAAAVLFIASDWINLAAVFRADEDGAIDPAVAASLNDVAGGFLGGGAALALGVLVAAAAVIALRSGSILPRWLAWISLALAVLLVSPVGYIGTAIAALWVVIVSVMLYVRQGPSESAGVSPAATPPGAGST